MNVATVNANDTNPIMVEVNDKGDNAVVDMTTPMADLTRSISFASICRIGSVFL